MRVDLLPLIPRRSTTLLDVGCGEGVTAAEIGRRLGLRRVVGVECAPEVLDDARERLDELIEGRIETVLPDLPRDEFDVILCSDVLEHVSDPWSILRGLRPCLSAGGCIVASLPNIGHGRVVGKILLDRFRYEDCGILDKTHLRFFTRSTVLDMFVSCGYEVEQCEGRSTSGRIGRAIRTLPVDFAKRLVTQQWLVRAAPVRAP